MAVRRGGLIAVDSSPYDVDQATFSDFNVGIGGGVNDSTGPHCGQCVCVCDACEGVEIRDVAVPI
jgi:hypothetical protein